MASIRLFCSSAARLKVSNAAKALDKIMYGGAKRKPWYTGGNPPVPELFGQPQYGNRKVVNRRTRVLNSVFHERITDLLSSSEIDPTLQDHGFLVTKVKYSSDGSAVHVYWTADSNITKLTEKLSGVAGKLRHTLTQLQVCGYVPHLNFIHEKNPHKAVEVEELLSKADYGPDYVPSVHRITIPDTCAESDEKIVKTNNVLGLERDAIMNQILKSMKQAKPKSEVSVEADEKEVNDFAERKVNFKKFLKHRSAKMKSMKQRERLPVYITPDEFDDRSIVNFEDDDYLDDEPVNGYK